MFEDVLELDDALMNEMVSDTDQFCMEEWIAEWDELAEDNSQFALENLSISQLDNSGSESEEQSYSEVPDSVIDVLDKHSFIA